MRRGARARTLLGAPALSAFLCACGSGGTPAPATVAATPVAECGHTLSTSAAAIAVRDVSSGTASIPSGSLGTDGRPIVLRFSTGCDTGIVVVNRTPEILRVGAVVMGNVSGVVAALVYGVSPGTGELALIHPAGPTTVVRITVTRG